MLSLNKNNDVHINYGITIFNQKDNTLPLFAKFESNRSIQILDKAEDYHAVITRLSIPMSSMPITYWRVDTSYILTHPGATIDEQVNAGIWKMKIRNTVTLQEYEANVMLIPESIDTKPLTPAQNSGEQEKSYYYWIYGYNLICDMLNTTFKTLYTSAGLSTGKYEIPYFIFVDGKFVLNIPVAFIYDGLPGSSYNGWGDIAFNNILASQCLGGFTYTNESDYYYRLTVPNTLNNQYADYKVVTSYNAAGVGTNHTVLQLVQPFEYAEQYISFVNQILITSSSLKCRKKLLSNNYVSNKSQSAPIIFTFQPDFSNVGTVQDKLIYYNANWDTNNILDLQGQDPLYGFDVQVYILDNYGDIWLFAIDYGKVIDIQFEFAKKIKNIHNV